MNWVRACISKLKSHGAKEFLRECRFLWQYI